MPGPDIKKLPFSYAEKGKELILHPLKEIKPDSILKLIGGKFVNWAVKFPPRFWVEIADKTFWFVEIYPKMGARIYSGWVWISEGLANYGWSNCYVGIGVEFTDAEFYKIEVLAVS